MRTEKENQLANTQAKILSEMTTQQGQDEEFQELLLRAEHLKDVKTSPKPKQTKAKVVRALQFDLVEIFVQSQDLLQYFQCLKLTKLGCFDS